MLVGKIKPKHHYIKQNVNGSVILNGNDISSDYYITFRINNKCNLSCEYCHWYDGDNFKLNDIKETIDNILLFGVKKNFKVMTFYFHGGEPSFHPNVIEILEYIRIKEKESNIRLIIEFQTNLSLSNYKEISSIVDFFDVSYHYLELKKKNKLKIFENNLYALDKSKLLNLDIMLENIEDETELNVFYDNVKKYIELPFQNSEMIYGFFNYKFNEKTKRTHIEFYKKYNKTQQTYLIDDLVYNTNDLFEKGLNCKDMLCEVGKKNIIINGNGDIYMCGAETTDFKNYSINPFSNIRTEKDAINKLIIKSKSGTICKWDYCGGEFYLGKKLK